MKKDDAFILLSVFAIMFVVFNFLHGVLFMMKSEEEETKNPDHLFDDYNYIDESINSSKEISKRQNLSAFDTEKSLKVGVFNATAPFDVFNAPNGQSLLERLPPNFEERLSSNATNDTASLVVFEEFVVQKPPEKHVDGIDDNVRFEFVNLRNANVFTSNRTMNSQEPSKQPQAGLLENGTQLFESNDFWNINDKPMLSNGHVGFIPFGDSIYMNGLFNGHKGESHRARIPNFANIQFELCSRESFTSNNESCSYSLNIHDAVFSIKTSVNNESIMVEQTHYAHRYYEAVIVNHIRIHRKSTNYSKNGKYS